MGGMAGVGVAPPPNHPPTSLAGGSTRARHPGPSIARARCGGKRYPGCLSVPLPPKSPPPPPTIPSKPPRPSSPGTTMLGKAHSRARAAAAAALARLIARAVCGGYGGGGGRLHRPSRALRAPRVTRVYAYVVTAYRARHRRFRPPRAGPARARCCGGGDCSLVRAEAEAVGLGVAFSYTARHARHARARARHHRASRASSPFLFPHAPTRARCDGGGARSLDSARGVWRLRWRWRAVEGAGGYIARHARRASRACARTSSPRIARVITVFRPPPRTTGTPRALLRRRRSLARSRARRRRRWGWGWRSVTPRVTRVTRARVNVITARRARHRRFPSPPCTTGTRALQRRRRSLAPSIARARCGGGDGGCGRSRRT